MKKHYRLRDDSPLYTIGAILFIGGLILAVGLMNSWELGLL